MNCNYKVNVKDIQDKYNFKIFSCGSYDDSEIKKMYEAIYMALPKETATGTSITLNDTAKSFMMNKLYATETSQETTTGKNLFSQLQTQTLNTIVLTANEDGSITINGTSSTSFNFSLSGISFEAGDYTLQCKYIGNLPNISNSRAQVYIPDQSVILDIPSNANNDYVTNNSLSSSSSNGSIRIRIEAGFNYQNVKLYPMLVKGNYTSETIGDFEKATGGATPRPDYPQVIHTINGDNEVVVCGKNFFNKNDVFYNKTTNSSGEAVDDSRYVTSNFIKVKPNTEYYIDNNLPVVLGYDINKNFVVSIRNSQLAGSFTTPNNCEYVRVRNWQLLPTLEEKQNAVNQCQLEFGTTSSQYEPYQSNSVLLTLGDKEICKIGNYEDKIFKAIKGNEIYDSLSDVEKASLDYGKWYLRKAIEKYTFTGNENWVEIGTRYSLDLTGYSSGVIPILCNRFISAGSWSSHTTTDNTIILYKDSAWQTARLSINYSGAGSLSNFKNYLSNNNVEACYPLATPTNEKFNDTIQEQLEDIYNNMISYEGQTNISQINDDLPFMITSTALKDLSSLGE